MFIYKEFPNVTYLSVMPYFFFKGNGSNFMLSVFGNIKRYNVIFEDLG